MRSTLPFACGERANTICTPNSSIARLNCVGARASRDPGTFLKTECRCKRRSNNGPCRRVMA